MTSQNGEIIIKIETFIKALSKSYVRHSKGLHVLHVTCIGFERRTRERDRLAWNHIEAGPASWRDWNLALGTSRRPHLVLASMETDKHTCAQSTHTLAKNDCFIAMATAPSITMTANHHNNMKENSFITILSLYNYTYFGSVIPHYSFFF